MREWVWLGRKVGNGRDVCREVGDGGGQVVVAPQQEVNICREAGLGGSIGDVLEAAVCLCV